MPSWGEMLKTFSSENADDVRREHLKNLSKYTGRDVIVYASGFLHKPELLMNFVDFGMNMGDISYFMEVIHGKTTDNLDLIIHSPGGTADAAKAIVNYIRECYTHVRVIVPHIAMSAATMLACSADEIIMGKHSALGPIDPQLIIQTTTGTRPVAAYAILKQFDRIRDDFNKDPNVASLYYPMIGQYGPDILVLCESAIAHATTMVANWLNTYMWKGDQQKSNDIATKLSDYNYFKSHGNPINYKEAKTFGLKIQLLEDDPKLQDLVLSVYHSVSLTFENSDVVKIAENARGKAKILRVRIFDEKNAPSDKKESVKYPKKRQQRKMSRTKKGKKK